MCHEAGIFSAGSVLYSVPRVTSLATDHVDRQDHADLALLGGREDPLRVLDAIMLGEALADALALCEQERIGHPAPEDEHVDLLEEVVDHANLVGHLGAAKDRRERPLRRLEHLREHLELALHEETRVGGQELGDANGGGVCPVRRSECIVDVDIGVRRERLGEVRVVGLLLGVESEVLQHEDLARAHALDRVLRSDPEGIPGDRYVAPDQLGQACPDGPQPQPVLDLPLRPAEVAGQDHRRSPLQQEANGGEAGADSGVVGDLPIVERDVQVGSQEDALASNVDVPDGLLVHPATAARP